MDQDQAYRDSIFLVVTRTSRLPRHCYKCNSPEIVSSKSEVIEHTPAVEELLEFAVGQVIPLPLSLSLNKKEIQLTVYFCRRHRSFHRIVSRIGVGVLIFSVLCFVASILTRNYFETYAIAAIILIGGSFIGWMMVFIAKERELVSRHKYQAPYFWIKGFGDDYLGSFPNLPK